jgi:hypothetical protein
MDSPKMVDRACHDVRTVRARRQHTGPYSKANFSGKIFIRYPAHNETRIVGSGAVSADMFDIFERVHLESGTARPFTRRNILLTNPQHSFGETK